MGQLQESFNSVVKAAFAGKLFKAEQARLTADQALNEELKQLKINKMRQADILTQLDQKRLMGHKPLPGMNKEGKQTAYPLTKNPFDKKLSERGEEE